MRIGFNAVSSSPFWRERVNEFMDEMTARNLSTGTIKTYSSILTGKGGFFDWLRASGELPETSDAITSMLVRRFCLDLAARDSVRGEKLSPRTIAEHAQALRVFFGSLAKNGHIAINPSCGIVSPRIHREEPKYVSDEDVAALVRAAAKSPLADKYLAALSLMIHAGLRVGSVTRLRVDQYQNQTLFIRQDKGFKDRQIPVNASLAVALGRWLDVREPHESPWLFPGHREGTHISVSCIERMVLVLCRAAKIEHISPHYLRAYFARKLDEAGVAITVIQELMGHASILTTQRYIKVLRDRCIDAVSRLDSAA